MNPKLLAFFFILTVLLSACKQPENKVIDGSDAESETFIVDKEKQEEIIEKHLRNGAWKHNLYSQEWQEEIDKGLAIDSTIAYLWQQKAMPLFKQGKYEAGMVFIDKAVKYDQRSYQEYRAFIKCIFAKTYREAIVDFEDCKKSYGNGFVMDHSYNFHIALSYLQLNEFKKAEEIFEKDYQFILSEKGEEWLHPLDLFYYGISRYEQKNYLAAIEMFNKALRIYPQFSEVQLYKADCLRKLGKHSEAEELQLIGEENGKRGYSINEDNVIYERYPYQIRWNN